MQLQLRDTWQGAVSAQHSAAAQRLPLRLRRLCRQRYQQACDVAARPGCARLMQRLLSAAHAAVGPLLVAEGPSNSP